LKYIKIMTLSQILLFGGVVALNQKISEQKAVQAPDAEDYDYAEDDDDDPADFSVGQFLGDDDSFIQTKSKRNLKEDVEEHYFNTVDGEEEENDELPYDDAFVQLALKNHVKLDQKKQPLDFLQTRKLRSNGPDDDEYDFAEDDDDDPSNFSVDQFLGDEGDSFIQTTRRLQDDDDDYADDRLGAGEFILTSDALDQGAEAIDADDDEEEAEEDDTVHRVLLQEAQTVHENHLNHRPSRPLKSLIGLTDVNQQFAQYQKKHHNDELETGWEAVDDKEDDDDVIFNKDRKLSADQDENDSDDDDDDLADDRLDEGMEQIIAAKQ